MNFLSIKNKICIVTGAYSGIGKDISNYLEQNFAIVIRLDKKKIKKKNSFVVNLNKKKEITKFSKIIKKKFKYIDCLINVAGISDNKNFIKNININLISNYYLTMSLIKLLKKKNSQTSSVINFTSLNAEQGFSNNPGYVASKGGLKMLTKSLALDFSKFNIRFNNVGPGYIKTNMTKKSYKNKKDRLLRLNRMLIKRYGNTKDLFGIVHFLISDSSSYATGQDFYIDGGFLSKGI